MPTPFAVVILGLMAVGVLVGLVFWVRAAQRRSNASTSGAPTHPEAPWSAEQSAEAHNKGNLGGWNIGS